MQEIDYTFDAVNNITGISNSAGVLNNGLGGTYRHAYNYDNSYRLISSNGLWDNNNNSLNYQLALTYTNDGRIQSKTQAATTLIGEALSNFSYNNRYNYHINQPHTIKSVSDVLNQVNQDFNWDANGNLISHRTQFPVNNRRDLCWDEENRLMAVGDDNYTSYYIYDNSGERTYKLTGLNTLMNINGRWVNFATMDNPTLYTSAYLVAGVQGYTKHYYAGSERVSSAIGLGGLANIKTPLSIDSSESWERKSGSLRNEMRRTIIECLEHQYRTTKSLEFLHDMTSPTAGTMDRYFYHPDHLGSTSWVTDSAKNGVQYCEYLPFGEPLVDQRSTTWSSRYTFSGKERDSETGYSYFGARYYHSDLSIWLSVDPLSDKYPNLTPYAYCANNPMKFVDPNGRMTTVALGDNDGDFYDRQGNYLGTDGVNDGKVYVLNKGFRAKTENTNVNWGGTLSDKHIKALKSKSEEITMDSDLGNMMRTVYAEMRGGDDNAKAIVAESIYNRSKLSSGYEKADGTYTGIVNKFYDVTKSGNATNNVFSNPTDYIYKNSTETDAWRSSVRASLKAHFGLSDVGKGVIFYNSASSTYYDKNPKMIKISLDVTHKGVKGLWKLK